MFKGSLVLAAKLLEGQEINSQEEFKKLTVEIFEERLNELT